MDGTAVKAYSQRSLDNKTGKSDPEARVGRARRGFILGYKVHAACCTGSELPLAFMVAPCNMNEKRFIKPLLEKLEGLGLKFKAVLADAQYDSSKVREAVRLFGAEPVIPYRRSSKLKNGLQVGKDFITRGIKRLVKLFRKRVSVEMDVWQSQRMATTRPFTSKRTGTGFHTRLLKFLCNAHSRPHSCTAT